MPLFASIEFPTTTEHRAQLCDQLLGLWASLMHHGFAMWAHGRVSFSRNPATGMLCVLIYDQSTLAAALDDPRISVEWERCAALSTGKPVVALREDLSEYLQDSMALGRRSAHPESVWTPTTSSQLVLRCDLEDRYTPIWAKKPWTPVPVYRLGLDEERLPEMRIWDSNYALAFQSLHHRDPQIVAAARSSLLDENSWLNTEGRVLAEYIAISTSFETKFQPLPTSIVEANVRGGES